MKICQLGQKKLKLQKKKPELFDDCFDEQIKMRKQKL
jgi:hypothetical protein